MIGVILFIGFWVVVGLTLFLIAISGGAGGARERARARWPQIGRQAEAEQTGQAGRRRTTQN